MTMASVNRAPRPSSLADVLEVMLDKGIVIDAYVRVAVVGIELLTIDARIIIASVDTYLRFAEAVNRLDLQPAQEATGLPGLIDQMQESGARHKTRGALQGAKDKASEVMSSITGRGDDDEDEDDDDRETTGRRPPEPPWRRPRRARVPARTVEELIVLLVHGLLREHDSAVLERIDTGSVHPRMVAANGLAAAVSEAPEHGLTADDAVAHLDLLVALAADVPVLPLPLGTTAPDDDAVREEVLTPAADQLEHQLAAVADLVEVRLDLAFDTDAVVADIAHGDPEIARLRDRSRAPGPGSPSGWPSARPWPPASPTPSRP